IEPDLTCLGKIIGGGLPVGAFGGSAEIMEQLSPVGPVYQAGTLSGNPIAMAAGIATLGRLKEPGVYEELDRLARALAEAVDTVASDQGIPHRINRMGSMLNLFFTDRRVETFSDVMTCDLDQFSNFFRAMLDEGIYLPPSQFETWFVSLAHGDGEIATTAAALARAFERIK
ncbi:aminotransferase class III-fold pyridoxal phosphate-dependent enzyme, partial [Thermodesulfobacteriota bacterium]